MEAQWTAEREVTLELALELIRRQFPALAAGGRPSIERVGVGWDNVAYCLAGRYIFRFPRRSVAVPLLETESRLLPQLAPHLPLSVPVPIFMGRPSDDYPWPFQGYERIAGRSACGAALDETAREGAAAALARFLRALHAFPPDEAARLGAPRDLIGRADLPKRVRQTRERLAEARARRLGAADPTLDRIWAEAEAGDDAPTPTALVHGDLYARHLLVAADGTPVGVIDWGDVHLGQPALDLSIAFAFLPPRARPAFFAAYGGLPNDAMLRRARLQALFSGVTLLIYGTDIGDAALVSEARVCLANVA